MRKMLVQCLSFVMLVVIVSTASMSSVVAVSGTTAPAFQSGVCGECKYWDIWNGEPYHWNYGAWIWDDNGPMGSGYYCSQNPEGSYDTYNLCRGTVPSHSCGICPADTRGGTVHGSWVPDNSGPMFGSICMCDSGHPGWDEPCYSTEGFVLCAGVCP